MRLRPYQRLFAWQEAHAVCLLTYKLTAEFPDRERFGLIAQMRSSSGSIATNIAEGNGRRTSKDKAHFFDIAIASLEELHYQFLLSKDLHYIDDATFADIDNKIQRTGYLISKLRSSLF